MSKRHARIVLKDGKFIIVDLKSTNGTYVNGRKITSPLVVKDSDKIYIGDFIVGVDESASNEGDGPSETTTSPPGERLPDVRPPRPTEAAPQPLGGFPPIAPMNNPGSSPSMPPGPMASEPAMPPMAAAPPPAAPLPRSMPPRQPPSASRDPLGPPPREPLAARDPAPPREPIGPREGAPPRDMPPIAPPPGRSARPGGTMPPPILGGPPAPISPIAPPQPAPTVAEPHFPPAPAAPISQPATTLAGGAAPAVGTVVPIQNPATGKSRQLVGAGARKVVGRQVSVPSKRGVRLEPLDPKVVKMLDLQSNILERLRAKLEDVRLQVEHLDNLGCQRPNRTPRAC